jgi:hypothetical protein
MSFAGSSKVFPANDGGLYPFSHAIAEDLFS